MARRLGPSIALGGAALLVALAYWSTQRRQHAANGSATVRGSEAPVEASLKTAARVGGLDPDALDETIEQLETQLVQLPATSIPEHYAKMRGLGPRTKEPTREALKGALDQASDTTTPSLTELLHALLEAQVSPQVIRAVERVGALQSGTETPDSNLASELELRALLERRVPDAQRGTELARLFSRVERRLEYALRERPQLSAEDWQLARALFRSAPQIRDAHLTPQLLRLFGVCARRPQPADALTAAARAEALATAAVAGMGRHEPVRLVVAETGSHLLQLLNDEPPTTDLTRAVVIRALRLTRRAVFDSH